MSAIVYGKRLCGQVDRVPGLFYTSTLFSHIDYLPLVPLASYLVLEGSEDGETFNGKPIPLRLKSVLAGYLRAWLAAVAGMAGVVAAVEATIFYISSMQKGVINVIAVFGAIAAMVGVLWFLFSTRRWWFLPVQLALLLASVAVYHDVRSQVPDAARVPNAAPGTPESRRHEAPHLDILLVANAAAILYTMTRLLTPVSYRRALELGRLLDIPPNRVTACLGRDPAALKERPPGRNGEVSDSVAEQRAAAERPRDEDSPSRTATSA